MNTIAMQTGENSYRVEAANYALNIHGHEIDVLVENTAFATLDIRCALPVTTDDDEGFIPDAEPSLPSLVRASLTEDEASFVWTNRSSLWEKTYTLRCTWMHYTFSVTVKGKGRVDAVQYFTGDMTQKPHGSSYEFSEGFTPCISWYDKEDYTFKSSLDCHRWSVLMVPPMFAYAFRAEGVSRRMGLGLVAQRGEHNFNAFDYRVNRRSYDSRFHLETDQHGHTVVDGEWTAPYILGLAGEDQWDILRQYADHYFTTGIAKPSLPAVPPRFWHGPMVCGWIEQIIRAQAEGIPELDGANERYYEDMVQKMAEYDLHPKALIIDDKWMTHYATDIADPAKWPDLRAFVDRRRAEGMSTMVWFKVWDPDGWDESICLTADNGDVRIDPSHPRYLKNLDEALHRILSSDEGCYDCDGFKLDFAFFIPIGRKVHSYSGKYGVELLYDMMLYIYERAKLEKPHALVNCSPCHPYFSHICDQARLHDYEPKNRNCLEDLTMRARLFSTAMPGTLLDTDNAGFNTRRDTMRWMLMQPSVGVPDLYSLSPTPSCRLTRADFAAIAQVWKEYSARIDALYPVTNR